MTGPSNSPADLGEGSSVLEGRYRRLLRVLPRAYRDVREEEMVATFLATMYDEDPENFDLTLKHGRPSGAEIRSVLALAARQRWGLNVAPQRFAAREAAWQMTLLAGLCIMWILAARRVVGLGLQLLIQPVIYNMTAEPYDVWQNTVGLHIGSWRWWQEWAYLPWIGALPLVVFGGRAGARRAVACAIPPAVVSITATAMQWGYGPSAMVGLISIALPLGIIGGLVALSTRSGQGLRVRARPLLVAAIVAVAVNAVYVAILLTVQPESLDPALMVLLYVVSFDDGWWAIAAAFGALWWAVRALRGRPTGPGHLLGLAAVAAIALIYSLASAANMGTPMPGEPNPFAVAHLLQILASGAILVISGTFSAWRMRALPHAQFAETGATPATRR